MNGAFGAGRADEHAVARVALALLRPLIRLALPLPHEPPILGEIRRSIRPAGAAALPDAPSASTGLIDRIVEARLRKLNQKWAELPIRNVLEGHGERHVASIIT